MLAWRCARHREEPAGRRGDPEASCDPWIATPGLCDPGVARDDAGSERSAIPLRRRYDRPENPLQSLEKIDFAPGTASVPESGERVCSHGDAPVIARSPQGDAAIQRRPATPGSPPPGLCDPGVARDDAGRERSASPRRRRYDRPENRPQELDKVDSAPGFSKDLDLDHAVAAPDEDRRRSRADRGHDLTASGTRPENRPQGFDRIDSAPGFLTDLDLDRADPAPDEDRRRSSAGRGQISQRPTLARNSRGGGERRWRYKTLILSLSNPHPELVEG